MIDGFNWGWQWLTKGTTSISSQEFNYTYDSTYQNITEVRDANGNLLCKYTYDSLDRLVREDNSVTNRTYLYNYDNNGNVLTEVIFAYTVGDLDNATFISSNLWSYGNSQWGDQLTNYNGGTITYDSVGNPLRYYNGIEFEWDNVNNLAALTDWDKNYTYTYNDSGIRTSKTINDVTHTYHLDGTRIMSEEYGNKLILYVYDEAGSVMGMAYRESSYASGVFDYYLFTKNLQGDIISIYDTTGSCVASYTYNAWGEHTVTNHTSANIGNLNPFRYRGYYFDQETGFYYLNARYYDPQIKRLISADSVDIIGATPNALTDKNLYAYCDNNPVMRVDETGTFWITLAIGALVGIASQLISDVATSVVEGEPSISHWSNYVGAAVGGAVAAAIPGGGILADAVGAATTTIVSSIAYNVESAISGRSDYYSGEEIFYSTVNNAICATVGGAMFDNSKLSSAISRKLPSKIKDPLGDLLRGAGIAIFDGIKNSKEFDFPNTHIWDSPSPRRYYF